MLFRSPNRGFQIFQVSTTLARHTGAAVFRPALRNRAACSEVLLDCTCLVLKSYKRAHGWFRTEDLEAMLSLLRQQ